MLSAHHDSFSRRFWRWLEGFGFTDDPFALFEADQERSYLPYFFVDRPYLHDILGNPAHPQTAFLLAGRGHGKTATREMVAYECTHAKLRRLALPVRYYDFSLLLEQADNDFSQISARHHVQAIIRATLKALAEDVPPTYFDLLGKMERGLLLDYVATFADPITQVKLGQILPDEPFRLSWNALSPLEILQNLAQIVTQLGQSPGSRYQALYILVDRIDEMAFGPEAAIALLKPLVSYGPLLEIPHVAFKFFLPIEVGEQLRQSANLRPDRLCLRTITWNQIALRKMVEQRLFHFSQGQVQRLEELCTSSAKTNAWDRLIQHCEGSPRTLLRLCQALIHHHVARTGDALIDRIDFTETLADFTQQLTVERSQPSLIAPTRLPSPDAATPSEQGLYLDTGGHVWVDGKPITSPLSELEFRLLQTLYQQAPEIVSPDTLIEAVWPVSTWTSGQGAVGDEQNLRKLITRLRNRLEPETPGQSSRFIHNARGRGYWLKIN